MKSDEGFLLVSLRFQEGGDIGFDEVVQDGIGFSDKSF